MKELVKVAKSATVVLDACEMGADRCVAAVHEYFSKAGIAVKVFALDTGGQLYLSSLSDAVITKNAADVLNRNEDIYVNLCCIHAKARRIAEMKNKATAARFRCTRIDSARRPYDMVMSGTENAIQRRVFLEMAKIISEVRI